MRIILVLLYRVSGNDGWQEEEALANFVGAPYSFHMSR